MADAGVKERVIGRVRLTCPETEVFDVGVFGASVAVGFAAAAPHVAMLSAGARSYQIGKPPARYHCDQ